MLQQVASLIAEIIFVKRDHKNSNSNMLLSIVIPTYNRSEQLQYSLQLFRPVIKKYRNRLEIIVCDDASTDDTQQQLQSLNIPPFFKYIRYNENIGLEKNLVHCGSYASGEYLWIFGDDDFIESEEAFDHLWKIIETKRYEIIVLNRTRRNFSLSKLISDDWMGIKDQDNTEYRGLNELVTEWGFISVIGFISVNVMRRDKFLSAQDQRFFGTMYPQLGMMVSAFSESPVLLVSEPTICHRTQTASEKKESFKNKEEEKTFMTDVDRRNAIYFGVPYLRMLNVLTDEEKLTYKAIDSIEENTVINGRLVDFLFENIVKMVNFNLKIAEEDRSNIKKFFANVSLTESQEGQLSKFGFMQGSSLRKNIGQPSLSKTNRRFSKPLLGPFKRRQAMHLDETHVISSFFEELDGSQMIDVGAHHGWSASPFLAKGWDVLAFEPDPENRAVLIDKFGESEHLTVVSKACSEKGGEILSFYSSEESTGVSSLTNFLSSHKKVCDVKTTTLTHEFAKHDIQSVDFLKIDAEGFDFMVLKGYPWESVKPAVIECEFEDSKTLPLGYKFQDVADFLVEKGYSVYVSEWHPVVRYGIRHDWRAFHKYPCELEAKNSWGNLIAFLHEPDEDLLLEKLVQELAKENQTMSSCELTDHWNHNTAPSQGGKIPTIEKVAKHIGYLTQDLPAFRRCIRIPWRWYIERKAKRIKK